MLILLSGAKTGHIQRGQHLLVQLTRIDRVFTIEAISYPSNRPYEHFRHSRCARAGGVPNRSKDKKERSPKLVPQSQS